MKRLVPALVLCSCAAVGCADDDAAPAADTADTAEAGGDVAMADAGTDADGADAAEPDGDVADAGRPAPPDIDPDNLPPGVFVPPYVDCREPLPGEPPGEVDGLVCTPVAIQGCTEPGRRYDEYAACQVVLTQRPYGPVPADEPAGDDDPRLQDEDYMAELAWVTEQVEACACTCCHSTEAAPNGPSNWYIEAGPLWIDTVSDDGLAMLSGLSPSIEFGAYDAADNNGFSRDHTGLPTNDPERMRAFLVAELERRGVPREESEAVPRFGGPLVAQADFVPGRCPRGQGVLADGTVNWGAASVRYLHVLEADATNPGVTPNRDVPDGTLWKLDAPFDGEAIAPGVTYGDVPDGATQAWPPAGAPVELEAGRDYLLYAQLDMALPIARCVFTYEP